MSWGIVVGRCYALVWTRLLSGPCWLFGGSGVHWICCTSTELYTSDVKKQWSVCLYICVQHFVCIYFMYMPNTPVCDRLMALPPPVVWVIVILAYSLTCSLTHTHTPHTPHPHPLTHLTHTHTHPHTQTSHGGTE